MNVQIPLIIIILIKLGSYYEAHRERSGWTA